ncbi:MAG: hypothetical protein ABI702_16925 [Burkholderiales bacterium]
MSIAEILREVRDPYERKARMTPGLLVVLPLLVPLLWIFGPKNPYLTALLGLVTGCGVIYALASIARGRGKRLEERLVREWGGMPTTCLLRHRDTFLDIHTKARYHEDITKKLGVPMPNAAQEATDPTVADQAYMAAARALRERTRSKSHALLLKENIAYGFHRNMSAMRPFGLATSLTGLIAGIVLSKTLQLHPLDFDIDRLTAAGGVTFAGSISLLVAWFYFTHDTVRRIGIVYAERLFESLKSLRATRTSSTSGEGE